MLFRRLLRILKIVVRRIYGLLNHIDLKYGDVLDKKGHDYLVRKVASGYDMLMAADEGYFANQYSIYILRELQERKVKRGGILLDLACGQGRIIDRLRNRPEFEFGKIIGVDFSGEALLQAEKYLNGNKDTPLVELIESDIIEYVENCPDDSVDVVLILEVLYMLPNFERVLRHIKRIVRPGGVAFISLRSDYYYGLSVIQQGLFASIPLLIKQNRGEVFGNGVEINWTNKSKVSSDFLLDYDLKVDSIFGVGACSGILNDPHDVICRPSGLSSKEQNQLQILEEYFGKHYPEVGRYMLFTATPV